jgi:hypothetical protein
MDLPCHIALPKKAMNHYVSFVKERIVRAYNNNTSKFHSLYFSVAQSSGYGKTRLLLEAGKKHLHTVYARFGKDISPGLPHPNSTLKQFFKISSVSSHADLFLAVTYKIALSHLLAPQQSQDSLPLFQLEGDDESGEKFSSFWDEVIAMYKENAASNEARNTIIDEAKAHQHLFGMAACRTDFDKSGGFYVAGQQRYPSELLVVFDESRFLFGNDPQEGFLSTILQAHQALQFRNMVLVFVDTLKPRLNVVPNFVFDSSAPPFREFHPLPDLCEVLTYNSCLYTEKCLDRPKELARILSHGRPVWNALFFSKLELSEKDAEDAITYAMVKLSNSPAATIFKNYFGGLASTSLHFGIWDIKDRGYVMAMVPYHMGTIMHLGDNQLKISVQYVPEPILAEAAATRILNLLILVLKLDLY